MSGQHASEPVVDAWSERIRECAASATPMRIAGGGSKLFYGNAVEGEILDTRAHAGIVDYEPVELVMVARAGTPLSDIESALAAHRQMLPFEPPHFGAGATLGGAIATGLSGPRRPHAGAARDLVLGVRLIDGNGARLSFGGRVMKNVAGFDVSRLMTGAHGTLGVLTEISLKCLPLPRAEQTRVFECAADEAIRRVNEWAAQPLPISATSFARGQLAVRLSGAESAVAAAARRLGGAELADAAAFWQGVREQTHDFFAGSAAVPLWRLSIKSTTPFTDLNGEQLIEWGGALRWLRPKEGASLDAAPRLRAFAAAHGGHATLFRGGDRRNGVFHPLPPVIASLHQRLKATFDPKRILNRGRMYAEL
jgi:glycolate oxidase FAD binding subunit